MECRECIRIFDTIGDGFNSPIQTPELLERVACAVTKQLELKGCVFRLLSRDQKVLDDVASFGLSDRFLDKGPVDAERSMTEALSGRMVLVEDCTTDPRIQYPEAFAEEGIVGCLTVPLQTRGQVLGTMRLFSDDTRQFEELELWLAEIVASFATRAITHCMFHQTLDRVTDSIRTVLNPDEVLDRIVAVISDELRAKGGTVHLRDPRTGRFRLRASNGLSRRYVDDVLDDVIKAVVPQLAEGSVQIYEPGDGDLISDPDAVRDEGIASQLFVPLGVRNQVIGVLGVYTNLPYRFSNDEQFFMQAVADQCALAIENARMYGALQDQYKKLVDDFQLWFERPYSGGGVAG
jgi:GAF domain-containing protein